MKALFVGIDPGAQGGIAIIDDAGHVVRVDKMPDSDADLLVLLQWPSHEAPLIPCRGVLEAVHSSPQMGVASAFSFGMQYGRARLALAAAQIPFLEVSPFRWQRRVEALTGGDKRVSRTRAQQIFPGTKVTHATADALLLAEYCRLTQYEEMVSPQSR